MLPASGQRLKTLSASALLAYALLTCMASSGWAADVKCVVSNGYLAIVRQRANDVGSDVIIRKAAPSPSKAACRYQLQKGDTQLLPKQNTSTFLAFQGGLLALDEGTSSDRTLSVIDVATRAKVIASVPYSDEPSHTFAADAQKMTFWQVGASVKPDQCPAAWRAKPDNKTAVKAHGIEEMALVFGPGAKAQKTGQTDCILTQDDL